MNKNKARLEILNYIVTQCKSIRYGSEVTIGGFDNNYFFSNDFADAPPLPGDLVCLRSTSPSEWYLSWYIEYQPNNRNGKMSYSDTHVLESIETGCLCNWRNVGFDILNRDVVKNNPHWKWTDKQYDFKDSWFRACYKKRNMHITLPTFPIFHEGGSVTLGTRKRFGLGSFYTKKFTNWQKVLVRDVVEFYDSTVDPD